MSLQANISDTTINQKSPQHPEVGVLRCQKHTDRQTDRRTLRLYDSVKNKHLNKMLKYYMVQIIQHIWPLVYEGPPPRLLKTTLYFLLESAPIGRQNELVAQLDHLVAQMNHPLLKPPNVWCEVCIQTQGGFSRCWFICATRWSNCMTEFCHLF